jgi:hypothetical protein
VLPFVGHGALDAQVRLAIASTSVATWLSNQGRSTNRQRRSGSRTPAACARARPITCATRDEPKRTTRFSLRSSGLRNGEHVAW